MVFAIILGAVSGIAGFLPLLAALQLAKRATDTSNLGHAGALLLGILVSFLVLMGTALACIVIAREQVLPFTLAEVGGLVASAIVFGIYKLAKK